MIPSIHYLHVYHELKPLNNLLSFFVFICLFLPAGVKNFEIFFCPAEQKKTNKDKKLRRTPPYGERAIAWIGVRYNGQWGDTIVEVAEPGTAW